MHFARNAVVFIVNLSRPRQLLCFTKLDNDEHCKTLTFLRPCLIMLIYSNWPTYIVYRVFTDWCMEYVHVQRALAVSVAKFCKNTLVVNAKVCWSSSERHLLELDSMRSRAHEQRFERPYPRAKYLKCSLTRCQTRTIIWWKSFRSMEFPGMLKFLKKQIRSGCSKESNGSSMVVQINSFREVEEKHDQYSKQSITEAVTFIWI